MAPFQNAKGEEYVREVQWNGYDEGLTPEVMAVLNAAQQLVDFPIRLNSGYRDPARNKAAGGAKKSQHLTGAAVDVSVKGLTNAQRTQLTRALAQSGAARIGAYSGNTAIHLDMAQGFAAPKGYSVYPMFDRSKNNMGRAPAWFKEGLDGTKVSYSPVAPIPASISPTIAEKRRLFSEGNTATRAIDGAIGATQPNGIGYATTTSAPKGPVSIPRGFDSPRGMDASPLYAGIIPKLDAATKWNDGGKGTPIQVANFDRMTDRDPYGIGSPPPITPLPRLSAPGAGATQQQRAAIAAVPQATERRYNPETNTWTAKQTLQPRPASNAPGQTWGVGGANQAGTTQMPRDVRPSSVPAAPALNPMLAAAVEKYEGKKAPVQGLMQVVPGRDSRTTAPVPMPYGAGDAARARVASLEPMPLPAVRPPMTAPMPLPRSAGDAARAKAAAQYPMAAPPMVLPPTPLPYSAGAAARAKAAGSPVLEYSGTLKKPDPWESVLGGVDEWWQTTPAGRLGNVLAGKPQAPSRTGIPEAFMAMLSGKPKVQVQPPQAPARKQPAFFGLLGNGGLFGGGPLFGGAATARSPFALQALLGGGASGNGGSGPAILTPQGNVHPGGWYDNSGNDMAYMPRSYQENPRNSNGGY